MSWFGTFEPGSGGALLSADSMLPTRSDLRRAMYRLLGINADDEALVENGEAQNKVANDAVQNGIWLAQKFLIGLGFREWLKDSAPLSFTARADGTHAAPLPSDFLRLAGDERDGALYDADGRTWGGLIDARKKRQAGPRAYWIENGFVRLGRFASPPSGLYIEYHYRHPTLTDETAVVDFPPDWAGMVAPEAAYLAMHEAWFPYGPEQAAKIADARAFWHRQAGPWMRKTQEPQKLRPPPIRGTHYFI